MKETMIKITMIVLTLISALFAILSFVQARNDPQPYFVIGSILGSILTLGVGFVTLMLFEPLHPDQRSKGT